MATFRELAKVQARIERALESIPPEDRRRVIEAVQHDLGVGPTAVPVSQCSYDINGKPCRLYFGHTCAHDLSPEPKS
jgi:hypothetical protein